MPSEQEIQKVSVLIIEDEKNQIDVLVDAIDDFNDESGAHFISCSIANNYTDSLNLLLTEDFDGVIIDLNLDQTKTDDKDLDGNKLIDIIVTKLRVPIIIRTGNPTSFESDLITAENNFLSIYTKDQQVDSIIEHVIKWFDLGFSKTLGTKGILEHYLNKLFWHQISRNLNEWENDNITSNEQEKSLIRFTLNVLQSYLEIDETGNFESFHPAEVYIKPAVKEDLFFCDILQDNNENNFIILTPSCEMAQAKYKKILLAKILRKEELEAFIDAKEKFLTNPDSKTKKSSLEKWFRNGHDNSLGYHYLPPYSDFSGGFIDFQDLKTINPSDEVFKENFNKIATVTNQFSKDISSRFTLYYARQGQPNLNSEIIIRSLLSEVEHS